MTGRARLAAVLISAAIVGSSAGQTPPDPEKPRTLFLAGDSTMATQPIVPATPARGWGQMLQPYFNDHVRVENLASSGQSTKSFRDKGRWQQIVDHVQPGD